MGRIFALSVLWLSGCQGDADFSEAGLKPITLNADEYRTEISAIDRLVFEEMPLDRERRTALAAKLEELAKGIRAKMDSRFLELESLELKRLAEMTKSLAPDAACDAWIAPISLVEAHHAAEAACGSVRNPRSCEASSDRAASAARAMSGSEAGK
jgi:hypothetical protein